MKWTHDQLMAIVDELPVREHYLLLQSATVSFNKKRQWTTND